MSEHAARTRAEPEISASDSGTDDTAAKQSTFDLVRPPHGTGEETEFEEAATVPAASRRLPPWVSAAAVLAVVLIALLAASGVLLARTRAEASHASDHDAVLSRAEQVASDLTTIGSADAHQHIDELLAMSTGDFRGQLAGYASVFQAVLTQGQVASKGSVSAAAVETLDPNQAVVLVTVVATVTNTQIPHGQPRNYRLVVTLQRTNGQWLASTVDVA